MVFHTKADYKANASTVMENVLSNENTAMMIKD